jgi:hypothetical protein
MLKGCCACPDIFVHYYADRNTTEGHIFNQHAKVEIRKSTWGGNSGKLLHGESIQGVSETNAVSNFNRCPCFMLVPSYSNVSIASSSNNQINRVTFSGKACSHWCK